MITLKQRKQLAFLVLAVSIFFAGYIATPNDGVNMKRYERQTPWGEQVDTLIQALNRREMAHLMGHVAIFGGVAVLLGNWGGGSHALAWRYVILGAVTMEAVQALVGWSDDSVNSLIRGISFDLMVDALAAGAGLWLVDFIQQRRSAVLSHS